MVVTLDEIKIHCRIELEETLEDSTLLGFEAAARLHTQNVLQLPLSAASGENIKQAVLLLIAHWYRNREASSSESLDYIPLGYDAILFPEKNFLTY